MQKHQQLIPEHKPEEGLYGDCWRASIACLLSVPVEDVPHPYQDGNIPFDEAVKVLNQYLEPRNLHIVEFPFKEDPENFGLHNFTNEYWMLLGQSSTGEHNHIVIMKGDRLVHSTNAARVIGPDIESGYYWASLLIHHPEQAND